MATFEKGPVSSNTVKTGKSFPVQEKQPISNTMTNMGTSSEKVRSAIRGMKFPTGSIKTESTLKETAFSIPKGK